MASQVGNAFVAISPSFLGFRKSVSSEATAAARDGANSVNTVLGGSGASAGASLGKNLKSAFTASAGQLGDASLKALQSEVSKAASAYSTASNKNADAIGKVRVAEAALADVRAKGNATSAQVVRAEESLASAQRNAASVSDTYRAAGERVTAAKKALTEAEQEQEAATKSASAASSSAGGFLSNLKSLFISGKSSVDSYITSVASASTSLKGFAAGGAIAGGIAAITSSILSAVRSLESDAISRVDTLNSYPKIMQNLGYSADDATASINTMSARLTGLPTALDTMTGAVQKMAPLTGSLSEATNLSLALNDALIAGGQSTAVQSSAMEQYTQMLSVGKVDLTAWNSLVTAMPGQMDQLAKSILGASANSQGLYSAMQDGTVSFADFNAAVLELDQNGANGFASFADQAKEATGGIGTSIDNMQTAITRGLANILDRFQPQITAIIAGITDIVNQAFTVLGNVVDWAIANANWLEPLATGLGIAAAAIGVITIATWAWNAALAVNPITWIILAIGALIGAIILLVTNWDTVVAWISQVWGGFVGWLTDGLNGLLSWWSGIWSAVAGFLTDTWNGIVSVATTVWQSLADFFTTMWDGIVTVFTNVMNFLSPVFQAIGIVIGAYIEVWTDIFLVFAAVLVTIWNAIVAAVTWVWNTISAFVTPIVTAVVGFLTDAWNNFSLGWSIIWNAISTVFTTVWNALVSWLTPIITGVVGFLTDTWNNFLLGWSIIWNAVSDFFTGIWNGLIDFLTPIVLSIYTTVMSTVQALSDWWTGVWNSISSFFSGIWNGMVGAVSTAIGQIGSFVGTIWSTVTNALGDVGSWLLQAGSDLVTGFWNGILNMGQWLYDQISGFFGGVVDWAKDVLGIQSPSKVFRLEVGQMVGEGMALGITDSQATVQRAMSSLTSIPEVEAGVYARSVNVTSSGSSGSASSGAVGSSDGTTTGPAVFHLYDSDNVLIGTMQGVADSAVDSSTRAATVTLTSRKASK